jgi:hypothetical protein
LYKTRPNKGSKSNPTNSNKKPSRMPTLKRLATSPTEFFLLLDRRQNTWTISELINPNKSKTAKKMLDPLS